jgi:hypothetical protein
MMKLAKVLTEIKLERLVARGRAYAPGSRMRDRAARALISFGETLTRDNAIIAMRCAAEALNMARYNDFITREAMDNIIERADVAFQNDRETTLSILEDGITIRELERRDFMPLLHKRNQLLHLKHK